MSEYRLTDPESVVNSLIEIVTEIPKLYEANEKEVERRDYERTDLDHLLELTTFGSVQGYRIAKMIQENRRRRREAKDMNFVMRPLYDFIKRNEHTFNQLNKLCIETAKLIKAQENRSYHPRSNNPAVLAAFKPEEGEVLAE